MSLCVLTVPPDPNLRWFTLCRIPDQKKKSSSGNLLVPIQFSSSIFPSPHSSSNVVAFGSNIYKFGGDVGMPSSRVSVLDCKSHTWHEATSMRVDRSSSSTAFLLNGKIYVAGGCKDRNSVNWIKEFDPKTQTWSSVTSPRVEIRDGGVVNSLVIEGKLHLLGDKIDNYDVYNPREGRWNPVGLDMNLEGIARYYMACVIDNVLFFWKRGTFYWFDSTINYWTKLKGLEGLRWRAMGMADCGGKMVILGEKCAEIALERRNSYKIWGKIEWSDVVLTVPKLCKLWNADVLSVIA